jgi:hypothetical protein
VDANVVGIASGGSMSAKEIGERMDCRVKQCCALYWRVLSYRVVSWLVLSSRGIVGGDGGRAGNGGFGQTHAR